MSQLLRTLYFANARIPTEKAHGIQVMKMCEALAEQGTQVELVVPVRANPVHEDAFTYYGVKPSFTITPLPCLDLVRFGPIGYALSTWSFLRAAKRYALAHPDARMYSREPLTPLFIPQAVIELHTRSGSAFVRRAIRRAPHLVAIAEGLKADLVKDGVPTERITVIPDGVDIVEFDIPVSRAEARTKLGLPHDAGIALYAGSFSTYSWKGVDTFLEAAILLPDVLFVGVGGTEDEAKKFVSSLPSNVRCVGHKPHRDIPLYLRAADVLVLPNKAGDAMSERYTSPLKLFEYMASGTPIVASDLPSIREVLTEEQASFCAAGDARQMARCVKEVLSDASSAKEISERALRCAREYTWEKRAIRILSLLCPRQI